MSHNNIKTPKPNYHETPAQDANSQNGHLPQRSRGICERYPGSKSLNVALYYETIMRRVVDLASLPFQEQIGLGLKERVAGISA